MFDRINKMISPNNLKKLSNINILLVGIGGVGGYVLEALVRSGFTNITIIDNDVVDESNLNRQIISLHSNIGQSKVEIAKQRCLDINPNCHIKTKQLFLSLDNIDEINYSDYNYIIDACDTVTTKILLIKKAKDNNIKIISCMGTGNRLNPGLLEITKLSKTYNDPLAKIMRKLLKENNIKDVLVCWSKEIPIKTSSRTPGSTIFVPSAAGIIIAAYLFQETIKDA